VTCRHAFLAVFAQATELFDALMLARQEARPAPSFPEAKPDPSFPICMLAGAEKYHE